MVPVISEKGQALFPTKERRARRLMARHCAVPYWQKGLFCIRLVRPETLKREEYPQVVLGIDPGSKREGYTVATPSGVAINITTNTPSWVKEHVATRRTLRRSRRQRKTPYRPCRENRTSLNDARLLPSTKSRWQAKLNMVKFLLSIVPITVVNVEDIKAPSKEGKKKWNISFSPLEVGKTWFYEQVKSLGIKLLLTEGYDTKTHRDKRGFAKSKAKLSYTWEAHNVDSHCLAELALQAPVEPYYGLYKVEYLEYHRRQLHVQKPLKGNIRKPYGGTVSFGMSRGSVVRYKGKLVYLGGSSKGKVAIHSIITGKRVNQFVKLMDIQKLYTQNRRAQFLPRLKPWVSLHNFS